MKYARETGESRTNRRLVERGGAQVENSRAHTAGCGGALRWSRPARRTAAPAGS